MIAKLAAMIFLFGVCFAAPVEESKVVEVPPPHVPVPLEPKPGKVEDLPKPAKPDVSDLKADASNWWHSWYYHQYPVYYYTTHHVPAIPVHYTWQTHY